jgi:Fe-S-cluster containining protein
LAIKLDLKAELLTELREMHEAGEDPPGTDDFLDEDRKWQCTACGACCEDVRWCLPEWMVEGTTRCKHLLEDNRCAIYEARPWVCKMSAFQPMPAKHVARGCAYMRNKFRGTPSESE